MKFLFSYPWSTFQSVQSEGGQDGSSEPAGIESHQSQRDCLICCEAKANVVFEPCGHEVSCEDCCARMKKCIECQAIIAKKTSSGK